MEGTFSESATSRPGGFQSEDKDQHRSNGTAASIHCAFGIGEGLSVGSKPLLDGYHMPAEWEEHER